MASEKRVKAADRTLDLFEAFQKEARPMSLSEIALAMDIPVSSCHVLVNTLISRGYLSQAGGPRSYYPTRMLYELGQDLLAKDPVLSKIGPLLEALRDKTNETVVLGRRLDRFVQYVQVLEAPQTIRYSARVSDIRSLHSSALGKALLGAMPPEQRGEVANTLEYQRVTPNTVPNAKRLLAEVAAGEARGWHTTRGESVTDVAAVAKSVQLGREHYAVAIAGPLPRVEPNVEKFARLLTATCAEMAAATR